jgi:hypothetical protein
VEEYTAAWEDGEIVNEAHFSRSGCDICGTVLGGDFEVWHYVDTDTQKMYHGHNACVDCVVFLANGEEPERKDEL